VRFCNGGRADEAFRVSWWCPEGDAATFTFVNRCADTVWPGALSNAGTARLGTTGFELPPGASRAVPAPSSWSGRLWARTGCAQDAATGRLVCATGDCGSGTAECAGAGASPPATLAEFTLGGAGGGLDFYDVSLVDGYNLPVLVEPSSRSGACAAAGCAADLNAMCPPELRSQGGAACRSACDAFGRAEYCCSGAHASPATCGPSSYSQVFKMACPRSYSYAFDDPTSTFTCAGGPDYTVTFCPGGAPPRSVSAQHSVLHLVFDAPAHCKSGAFLGSCLVKGGRSDVRDLKLTHGNARALQKLRCQIEPVTFRVSQTCERLWPAFSLHSRLYYY
jgi:hypothetical protein